VTNESELKPLLGYLQWKRRHILEHAEGQTDTDLLRRVLPSGWNAVELVHHLTIDVERFWFRGVMFADPQVTAELSAPLNARTVVADRTPADVIDLYRTEIAHSNDVIGALELYAPARWWPNYRTDQPLTNMREVLLHVLTETATHAGHLDAVREIIDGTQHLTVNR
jgi:hypothetical protein